jgi:hypothetical protein
MSFRPRGASGGNHGVELPLNAPVILDALKD